MASALISMGLELATRCRSALAGCALALSLFGAAAPASAVVLSLGSGSALSGGQVRLLVSGDTDDLFAAQFVVRYDGSLLSFDAIDEVSGGYSLMPQLGPVTGSPMATREVSVLTTGGSGTDYFYLLFTVLGSSGSTTVEMLPLSSDASFSFVDPQDPLSGLIEHRLEERDPLDAGVTIRPNDTPLPIGSSAWLALAALAALALRRRAAP